MVIRLGKKMWLNPAAVSEFNQLNFNFQNVKQELKKAIVHHASVYLDKKSSLAYIYLEIENLRPYQELAKQNEDKWWAHLQPVEIPDDEDSFQYVWENIFRIEDKKDEDE
ncbi:L-rhamnose mutarotase [uncultured Lactobacillus sp.]|uniref:L-rhamnose mutarotase n=1 Tax=uncultured Lactobacillus sp. TaxID=153152 RepID=UPI002805CC89|nr:L-rhamnose mutarotase [uncultured Lactobacillus sp.]